MGKKIPGSLGGNEPGWGSCRGGPEETQFFAAYAGTAWLVATTQIFRNSL